MYGESKHASINIYPNRRINAPLCRILRWADYMPSIRTIEINPTVTTMDNHISLEHSQQENYSTLRVVITNGNRQLEDII
jgi:hypothetical protein